MEYDLLQPGKQIQDPIPTDLERELRGLINTHSRENDSDTPDFILAEYMMICLKAFERATTMRSLWYEDKQ